MTVLRKHTHTKYEIPTRAINQSKQDLCQTRAIPNGKKLAGGGKKILKKRQGARERNRKKKKHKKCLRGRTKESSLFQPTAEEFGSTLEKQLWHRKHTTWILSGSSNRLERRFKVKTTTKQRLHSFVCNEKCFKTSTRKPTSDKSFKRNELTTSWFPIFQNDLILLIDN